MQSLKIVLLFGWVTLFSCAASPVVKTKINWLTLEEATAKLQQEKKPLLIDLYTDWCGWCKVMDKRTYANKNVAAYIEEKFYPVKLDAETKEKLLYQGKTYQYNSAYKTNELAVYLTQGQLSFPTTVIIPPGVSPQPIPGFLAPRELEVIVKYFGERNYQKMGFEQFQQSYKPGW